MHSLHRRTPAWRALALWLVVAAAAGMAWLAPAGAARQAQSGATQVFLPLVRQPSAAPAPTPPPGGASPAAAYFLPFDINGGVYNTQTPHLAVDARGGVHALTATFDALGTALRLPVIYSYCASDCADPASFQAALLGGTSADDDIYDGMLALDPAGHPRLLLFMLNSAVYASCDAGCASPAAWQMTSLSAPGEFGAGGGASGFAIDPLGRPRFISSQSSYAWGGAKTWYNACDAQCDDPASWRSEQIASAQLLQPRLAFTHDGRPRLAFQIESPTTATAGFAACEALCASTGAWGGVSFADVNVFESSFDLRVDANDQPHIALFTGTVDGGALQANHLYYLWCATSCADGQASGWQYSDTGLAETSGVDMALGAGGQVWLAYGTDAGLSVAACASACESDGAQWRQAVVDTNQGLNDTQQPNPVPGCAPGHWSLGKTVSLALDSAGAPRVAYDARHLVLCSGAHVETDIAWARFSLVQ